MATQILRLPAVRERTGLSRTTVYDFIRRGEFPPPIKLGARASGWDAEAVERWIQTRLMAARGRVK